MLISIPVVITGTRKTQVLDITTHNYSVHKTGDRMVIYHEEKEELSMYPENYSGVL